MSKRDDAPFRLISWWIRVEAVSCCVAMRCESSDQAIIQYVEFPDRLLESATKGGRNEVLQTLCGVSGTPDYNAKRAGEDEGDGKSDAESKDSDEDTASLLSSAMYPWE